MLGLGPQREHRLGDAGSFEAWGLQRQQRVKKSAPLLPEAFACATVQVLGHLRVGAVAQSESVVVFLPSNYRKLFPQTPFETLPPPPPVIYTTGQPNIKEF